MDSSARSGSRGYLLGRSRPKKLVRLSLAVSMFGFGVQVSRFNEYSSLCYFIQEIK
jgi:hypothetical protein